MCPKWNKWIRLKNDCKFIDKYKYSAATFLGYFDNLSNTLIICPILPFLKKETHNFFIKLVKQFVFVLFFFRQHLSIFLKTFPEYKSANKDRPRTLRCRRRWHTWFCFNWNWLFCPLLKNAENLFSCKEVWRSLSIESTKIDDRSDIGLMPRNHSKCLNEKLIFLVKLQRVCWAAWFFMFSIVTFPSWLQGEMIVYG